MNRSVPAFKSISDFNSSNPEAVTAASSAKLSVSKPKVVEPRADGMCKCINKGCQIVYDPKLNSSDSCTFHPGKAVFHDAKKYWSCCETKNKVAYDFDEFLAIPGCETGFHTDAVCCQ